MFGFALLGPPNESFQVPAIGYDITTVAFGLGDVFTVDVGAPKNFGQGYRWNTPTNYYAFDASFATYFGSNGMAEVDKAFALYNGLGNLDDTNNYHPDLLDHPYRASRVNQAAFALSLYDIKSVTMQLLIEQLGLASPDRYTWALNDRYTGGGLVCGFYEYTVIQRNYDPATKVYTPYVNNQLLGYTIIDLCSLVPNPFAPFVADAAEYTTDPKDALTSVAAQALNFGAYYINFTRDDIGGLRYLYSATNVYNESAETNSLQLVTNNLITLLTTSNLTLFAEQAQISDPATLSNLYPGLVIDSFTNYFTNVVTTNFTFVITNGGPGSTAGQFRIVAIPTLTTNTQTLFAYTFDNVIIVHSNFPATQTFQQIGLFQVPGAVAGTFTTNVVNTTVPIPFPTGDFYILPPNLCGPFVNPDGLAAPPFNFLQLATPGASHQCRCLHL